MRCSMERVAVDCAPVKPSIRGSITSGTRSGAPCRLTLEKSVLAALSSASSKATGVGGGGGGGTADCAHAGVDAKREAQTTRVTPADLMTPLLAKSACK